MKSNMNKQGVSIFGSRIGNAKVLMKNEDGVEDLIKMLRYEVGLRIMKPNCTYLPMRKQGNSLLKTMHCILCLK